VTAFMSWFVNKHQAGRVKLLSVDGSAAVLFNGVKESWRLAQKIPGMLMRPVYDEAETEAEAR